MVSHVQVNTHHPVGHGYVLKPRTHPAKKGTRFSGGVGAFASAIFSNDATRVIAEDIVGLGVLRTIFDLCRGFFFKTEKSDKWDLNFPMARERIVREVGNIISSNFLGGLVIYGLGSLAGKMGQANIINQFANNETRELFEHLAQKSTSQAGFIENLAKHISPKNHQHVVKQLQHGIASTDAYLKEARRPRSMWQSFQRWLSPPVNEGLEKVSVNIAKHLNPKATAFDLKLALPKGGTHDFAINTLITDSSEFLTRVRQGTQSTSRWQHHATELLKNTGRINRWALPLAVGAAMAMTIAVPYWNKALTRKVDKIASYPGEIGLRETKKVHQDDKNKPLSERLFPFISKELREGRIGSTLISLIPIPLAIGLVNNKALMEGHWKASINKLDRRFFHRFSSMFSFRKGFPFTSIHQIAALCALVAATRLFNSRDKIEFRERLIDTFSAWGLWIVAVPWMKKKMAQYLDKAHGTKLIKNISSGPVFRTPTEIKRFFPKVAKSNLKTLSRLKGWTFAGLVILMGLIEPYIAIKWTEHQVKKDIAVEEAKRKKQRLSEQSKAKSSTNTLSELLRELQKEPIKMGPPKAFQPSPWSHTPTYAYAPQQAYYAPTYAQTYTPYYGQTVYTPSAYTNMHWGYTPDAHNYRYR